MPGKVEEVGCTGVFYNLKVLQRPDAVATPAFLPCEMLWVSTNRMSGPGRSVSAAEAAIK